MSISTRLTDRANLQRGRGTYANDRVPVLGVIGRETGHIRLRAVDDTRSLTLCAFVERMEAILRLYAQAYDPERPMVCFDEKMTQLLADVCEPLPLKPQVGRRQDYEYKREGTRNLFMFVEPKAGRRAVLITRQRGKRDFAQTMRYLVDVLYPDAPLIDVVLDHEDPGSFCHGCRFTSFVMGSV